MFFFFSWPCRVACGIIVPRPGIEPVPPAVEARSLNHWTTGEVPYVYNLKKLPNCSPKWLHHFTYPSALYEGSCLSTSWPTFVTVFFFFNIPILIAVKQYLIEVLLCNSLVTDDNRTSFHVLI